MKHFKFVGGPCDGEYHRVDSETFQRGYLDVAEPPSLEPSLEPFRDMEEVPIEKTFEYITYTLRHLAGPNEDTNDSVYYFADSRWSDIYSLSQLIHHYPGKP